MGRTMKGFCHSSMSRNAPVHSNGVAGLQSTTYTKLYMEGDRITIAASPLCSVEGDRVTAFR
jgi:hypothetical protein